MNDLIQIAISEICGSDTWIAQVLLIPGFLPTVSSKRLFFDSKFGRKWQFRSKLGLIWVRNNLIPLAISEICESDTEITQLLLIAGFTPTVSSKT